MERSSSTGNDSPRFGKQNLSRSSISGRQTPSSSLMHTPSRSTSSFSESRANEFSGNGNLFKIGKPVLVQGKKGVIRFYGETQFSTGNWLGVELSDDSGKNDGSVQGVQYFSVKPKHGLFVRSSQVKLIDSAEQTESSSDPKNAILSPKPRTPLPKTMTSSNLARRKTLIPEKTNVSNTSGVLNRSNAAFPQPPSLKSVTPGTSRVLRAGIKNTQTSTPLAPRSSSEKNASIRNKDYSLDVSDPAIHKSFDTEANDIEMKYPEGNLEESRGTEDPSLVPLEPNYTSDSKDLAPKDTWKPSLSMNESVIFESTPKLVRQEPTVSAIKYEELKSKVKFLEQKRTEERQVVLEAEEFKSKFAQTMKVQDKLVEKLKALKSEHSNTLDLYNKSQTKIQELETTLHEEREMLEIVAVEKEMAEEQVESYKEELLVTKEQIEELNEKVKLYEGTESQDPSGNSSIESAQLRSKNIRLVEALRMLRDEKESEINSLKLMLKDAEKEAMLGKKVSEQVKNQQEIISSQLEAIQELKQQLDDAGDSEDLILELSERNSKLNERVGDLESQVEHWQSMHEVSEEMYENASDEIKILNTELGRLEWKINQKEQQISSMEATIEENQSLLGKFKEAVFQLRQERSQAEEKEQEMKSKVLDTEKAAKNLEKLAYNAGRTNQIVAAREIELALEKLKSSQLRLQLEIVGSGFTDDLNEDEKDSIKALLTLQRIKCKASLALKRFENISKSDETVNTEFYAIAKTRRILVSIEGISNILTKFLLSCDEPQFKKMSFLHRDSEAADFILSELVENIHSSETSLLVAIDICERAFDLLDKLFETTRARFTISNDLPKAQMYIFEIGSCIDESQCAFLLLNQFYNEQPDDEVDRIIKE
ncbi:hypothetical protein BB560_003438, partial [Smittium megazygosporum]